jgi:hypothetical protein
VFLVAVEQMRQETDSVARAASFASVVDLMAVAALNNVGRTSYAGYAGMLLFGMWPESF